MRRFLLPRITHVSGEGVVECFPVDVLGVRGQVCLHRSRKVVVCPVWHGLLLLSRPPKGRNRTPAALSEIKLVRTAFRYGTPSRAGLIGAMPERGRRFLHECNAHL